MFSYFNKSAEELNELYEQLLLKYREYQNMGLKLDMSRGKPGADQLDLSTEMLEGITSPKDLISDSGIDTRNYGVLDGIPEAKLLFSQILEVDPSLVIVAGNSSLNLMYDTIAKGYTHGFSGCKPWAKCDTVKFLCPSPGYDRHFGISESFSMELIMVPMTEIGPDMDLIEKLVRDDESIKGMWCVPKYSNPDGITYSDETVKRLAALKPAAKDFRIIWDNAYAVHHIDGSGDKLLNIMEECRKNGNEDMPVLFCSTSKITFPGAGVAAIAASKANIEYFKKLMFYQTIGHDKINQLRHVRYLKDLNGINRYMKKHAAILKPKFDAVISIMDREIKTAELGSYHSPRGGYFISLYTLEGCARRTLQLCFEAGITMTPAGAAFPYGKDPKDSNIRIAPSFPPIEELKMAAEILCICVKIASIEKLTAKK